jgi:transcriptional regulator with XRE-family HTH domain
MARKSLRVSQEQLEKAKRAFERTGWTQKELATEVDLRTRQPVGNFLAGKTVDRKVFQEICFKLDLNWQEVADLEEHTRSHSAEVPPPEEEAQDETVAKNSDFVGREEAIANTTSEEETLEPLRLRLEPLTERVRAWQLEEESLDQQLDALVDISSDDPNFVGRGQASAHLKSLVNEGAKVILIQAEGGVGKTTLARQWFELQGLKHLELRVGITSQNLHSVEDWVRHKLRDRFQENPERNFLTMLEQLKLKLQTERMGVLIDNLEPALINGEFIEPHLKLLYRATDSPSSSKCELNHARHKP